MINIYLLLRVLTHHLHRQLIWELRNHQLGDSALMRHKMFRSNSRELLLLCQSVWRITVKFRKPWTLWFDMILTGQLYTEQSQYKSSKPQNHKLITTAVCGFVLSCPICFFLAMVTQYYFISISGTRGLLNFTVMFSSS